MRILHTSDWHLGHALHGRSRDAEHRRFLDWLLDRLDEHAVDALIIPGDIFDSANPPTAALQAWYEFLGAARRRNRGLDIVVAGGNHDSAARLDAPRAILSPLDVHVVGGLPRLADGAVDHERLLVPVSDDAGDVAAWVVAMPFLRPADLPRIDVPEGADPLVEGVRRVYADAFAAARARLEPGQSIIATGHCFMRGGRISEDSERKVLGGNQHALPLDVFDHDVAYVALGHLHLAQSVAGADHVRYCGAPLPLSISERDYPHQALLVELDAGRIGDFDSLYTPRAIDMLRIPKAGYEAIERVLDAIDRLPALEPGDLSWARPFLEVAVQLARPEPGLRQRVEAALDGKSPRLARLIVDRPGHGRALADAVPDAELGALTADEVFRRRYAQKHTGEPPASLVEAFHELLQAVEQEDAT